MASYEGENKRKWHVAKEISVADVVGLAVAFAAVLTAYGSLNTRVALMEQSQTLQQVEFSRSIERLEQAMSEVNKKLDRLIENNGRTRPGWSGT